MIVFSGMDPLERSYTVTPVYKKRLAPFVASHHVAAICMPNVLEYCVAAYRS